MKQYVELQINAEQNVDPLCLVRAMGCSALHTTHALALNGRAQDC